MFKYNKNKSYSKRILTNTSVYQSIQILNYSLTKYVIIATT